MKNLLLVLLLCTAGFIFANRQKKQENHSNTEKGIIGVWEAQNYKGAAAGISGDKNLSDALSFDIKAGHNFILTERIKKDSKEVVFTEAGTWNVKGNVIEFHYSGKPVYKSGDKEIKFKSGPKPEPRTIVYKFSKPDDKSIIFYTPKAGMNEGITFVKK